MTAAFNGDGRGPRQTVSVHNLRPKVDLYGQKDALRLVGVPSNAPNRTLVSTEDFLAELRLLRQRSGTSFRDIGVRSDGHLPKATAHKMVEPGQRKLPSRAEQVTFFVKACGATSLDVKLWLDQWRRLKTMDAGRPVSVPEPPAPQSLVPRIRTTLPIPEPEPTSTSLRVWVDARFGVSLKVALAFVLYTVFVVCLTIGVMTVLSLV